MTIAKVSSELMEDLSGIFKDPNEAIKDLFKLHLNIEINKIILKEVSDGSNRIDLSDGRCFSLESNRKMIGRLRFQLKEQEKKNDGFTIINEKGEVIKWQ